MPQNVSGRVVNTSMTSPVSAISNRIVAPSERPIQLRCIVFTRSGHSESWSMSSSSRCE